MNIRMICHTLGNILRVEAALMMLPTLVGIIYGDDVTAFYATIGILLVVGSAMSFRAPKNKNIYAKEGLLTVALCWVLMSAFGALPFFLSGAIPSYMDAFFETVSGFTTTGSTILVDIEALPMGMLFWRSFTHWIGGMGVLVFVLAIIPMAEGRNMHLMRAEVPGPTVGKLVPKMKSTAKILYGLYLGLTIIEVGFLMAGGMPFIEALLAAFSTAGTGGFCIKNASIAYYNSAYIDAVITVFMILFGINFNLYYLILIKRFKQAFKSEELRWYLGIILTATVLITLNIMHQYSGFMEAGRYASFQVGSIITTTGFITADYGQWPMFSQCILLLLMVFGACAGSTGGGIKTARLIILVKSMARGIKQMTHPRTVSVVTLDGKTVDDETMRGVNYFFTTYIALFALGVLLVSLDGMAFGDTFGSVLTCINNVGPGMGSVGAVGNFAHLSVLSKGVLTFMMLVGRLEIFPMLMLVLPSMWRKQ
ncbi:MAG: TrkH family potassium uptake protein [Clostridiales bacterium]|nr:TrkH family potassium uptake protein [Clostridiales bacterium]